MSLTTGSHPRAIARLINACRMGVQQMALTGTPIAKESATGVAIRAALDELDTAPRSEVSEEAAFFLAQLDSAMSRDERQRIAQRFVERVWMAGEPEDEPPHAPPNTTPRGYCSSCGHVAERPVECKTLTEDEALARVGTLLGEAQDTLDALVRELLGEFAVDVLAGDRDDLEHRVCTMFAKAVAAGEELRGTEVARLREELAAVVAVRDELARQGQEMHARVVELEAHQDAARSTL